MPLFDGYYRVWSEIDLDAVRKNIEGVRGILSPGTNICAVVKADGYGLGAVPVSKAVEDIVDYFAVASIDEAQNLIFHGIRLPVVVLGFVHESAFEYAITNGIRIAVFDKNTLDRLNEAAGRLRIPAKIHIAVDTGMHRIGITPDSAGIDFVKYAASLENIETDGIFTHFFLSDACDKTSARKQLDRFLSMTEKLESEGIRIPVKHCANSAAALEMPETNMNMARLGITMYGMYPSDEIMSFKPYPAMSLKSHVIMVKPVTKGETVGYGGAFKAERDSVIATVSIGYADGYRRNISNKGAFVLVNGKRVPVVGRICMDQMMLDATDFPEIRCGDVVTLIGRDGDENITIEEISEYAGTNNYEFSCGISKRVPRIYFRDKEISCIKDHIID